MAIDREVNDHEAKVRSRRRLPDLTRLYFTSTTAM